MLLLLVSLSFFPPFFVLFVCLFCLFAGLGFFLFCFCFVIVVVCVFLLLFFLRVCKTSSKVLTAVLFISVDDLENDRLGLEAKPVRLTGR